VYVYLGVILAFTGCFKAEFLLYCSVPLLGHLKPRILLDFHQLDEEILRKVLPLQVGLKRAAVIVHL
jgi:hypothetical protein